MHTLTPDMTLRDLARLAETANVGIAIRIDPREDTAIVEATAVFGHYQPRNSQREALRPVIVAVPDVLGLLVHEAVDTVVKTNIPLGRRP